MFRKECAEYQQIYRKSRTARHERRYKHGYQPAATVLYYTRGHHRRNVAPEAHNQRDERLAVQTYLVHDPVHYESRPRHISRIFEQRYEQKQQQYVRQKDYHAPDTAYYAAHDQILKSAIGHDAAQKLLQTAHQIFYPVHRVISESESRIEYQPHYG